jgi:4-carboxymuconolactone decarboxylase
MRDPRISPAECLLRELANGDETSLLSVVSVSPAGRTPVAPRAGTLTPKTCALVHLAALLATDASTTSLRWAVELAEQVGARDEDIVEVLATLAAVLGSARVVAVAPRLALAIGYDLEVDGWDGN